MCWVTDHLNIVIQCPCGEQHDVEEKQRPCRVTFG